LLDFAIDFPALDHEDALRSAPIMAPLQPADIVPYRLWLEKQPLRRAPEFGPNQGITTIHKPDLRGRAKILRDFGAKLPPGMTSFLVSWVAA
jgi:hypothetical protein